MGYTMIKSNDGDSAFEKDYGARPIVFLGGNCRGRDWRIEFLHRFEHEDVVFINPRRESFPHPEEQPNEHAQQVSWERQAIGFADIALFWLGEGLANQAARVEIGFALGAGKDVIIGAEPGFLGLEHLSAFSGMVLSNTLDGVMDRLRATLDMVRQSKAS